MDPYALNDDICDLTHRLTKEFITRDSQDVDSICQEIFDWILENITYGSSGRRGYGVGIRSAQETYWQREGVCCEMSYLFIAMCRHAGIECYPVLTGEKVMNPNHMLAGVLAEGSFSLFDLAAQAREFFYPKLSIWDDVYCRCDFNTCRGVHSWRFPYDERVQYPSREAQDLTRILRKTHDLKIIQRQSASPQIDVKFAQRITAEKRRCWG